MKKVLSIVILPCMIHWCKAQNTLIAIVKNAASKESLAGASVQMQNAHKGVLSDSNGIVLFTGIPDGKQVFIVEHVGFEVHEEAVVVTSTRSTRTIQHIPTRIELIAGEELEEKGNMKPDDIRMMLNFCISDKV